MCVCVCVTRIYATMRSVSLSYEFQYVECDLADKFAETLPVVQLFYDTHFERSERKGGIVSVPLDEDNADALYTGTLKAQVHRRRANRIPPTASIGLASWALRRNQFGFLCYIDAGTSHIKLGPVVEYFERNHRNEPYECELDLVLHTTAPMGPRGPQRTGSVEKGKLLFRVTSIDMDAISFLPPLQSPLSAPMEDVSQSLMGYIESCLEQQSRLKDTIPGTARIHAPMDISESGVELTESMYLPVTAYAMFETPRSNLGYWCNVFERVMARQGMQTRDFHDFDLDSKAMTMAQMMIFEAETFDYVSDEVDRNNRRQRSYDAAKRMGYENFGDATRTTSGDCEDSACTIQMTFRSFAAFKFPPGQKALIEMQNIARQYVPMLTLAVVHGAKAEDDENAPKGAHMYVTFLTKHQVQKALAKTPQGKQALQTLPWDHDVEANPELPTLFGEGTGMINPLGVKDPLLPQKRYLAQAGSLGGFKKEIPHERGAPSPFYLGNLLGITSEFFSRGGNVGGFVFGTVARKQGSRAKITRGTYWTDVINQAETMALIPQPPINDTVMGIMREATALRVPPKAMVLNKESALGSETNALLDRLVQGVASMNRKRGSGAGATVDIFMRPHQFDDNTISAVLEDMYLLDRVWKVDYELEHVTDALFQYRVMFSVRNE